MNAPRPTLPGVAVGLVTSLADPDALGRVQVRYPVMGDEVKSAWARIASPMGGADRGLLYRPEPGDEVLLAFEQGLAERPYLLGGLWSRQDRPPDMGDPAEKNNLRVIRSRSGHVLVMDDTESAEKIRLVDKDKARSLQISCADKEILLDNTDSGGVIRIRSANGQVTIAAGEKISVHCTRGDVEVIADTGAVTVTAVNVNVTAKAAMSLKSTTQLEIESAGPVTIKGAIVKIN